MASPSTRMASQNSATPGSRPEHDARWIGAGSFLRDTCLNVYYWPTAFSGITSDRRSRSALRHSRNLLAMRNTLTVAAFTIAAFLPITGHAAAGDAGDAGATS